MTMSSMNAELTTQTPSFVPENGEWCEILIKRFPRETPMPVFLEISKLCGEKGSSALFCRLKTSSKSRPLSLVFMDDAARASAIVADLKNHGVLADIVYHQV